MAGQHRARAAGGAGRGRAHVPLRGRRRRRGVGRLRRARAARRLWRGRPAGRRALHAPCEPYCGGLGSLREPERQFEVGSERHQRACRTCTCQASMRRASDTSSPAACRMTRTPACQGRPRRTWTRTGPAATLSRPRRRSRPQRRARAARACKLHGHVQPSEGPLHLTCTCMPALGPRHARPASPAIWWPAPPQRPLAGSAIA